MKLPDRFNIGQWVFIKNQLLMQIANNNFFFYNQLTNRMLLSMRENKFTDRIGYFTAYHPKHHTVIKAQISV